MNRWILKKSNSLIILNVLSKNKGRPRKTDICKIQTNSA